MSKSFERIQERAEKALQQREKHEELPAVQLKLPGALCARDARGVPDSMLRSALFSATRRGKRRYLDDERIAAVSNIEIRQTGQQLQQVDLDVWIELVRLAAEQESQTIHVPLKALLKRLRRDTGQQNRKRLLSTLLRLNAVVVSIEHDKRVYSGSLIFEQSRDEQQHLVIQLNPRIARLFDKNGWTHLQLAQRRQLRSPLAQWLHAYLSSHQDPFPVKVATLRELSGSNSNTLFHFRSELRSAIGNVQAATSWRIRIDSNDKLITQKTPKSVDN